MVKLARRGERDSGRVIRLQAMLDAEAVVNVRAQTVDVMCALEPEATVEEGDALEAVPVWVELIPAPRSTAEEGHVELRDWRQGFRIDDMASFIDSFNNEPEERRAKVLDWEHRTGRWGADRNPAAGWIEKIEARGEAVWGFIRWTPEGRDDVRLLRYRYISPVVAVQWQRDLDGNIDWDSLPVATKLVNAALTNDPATYIRDLAMTDTEPDEGDVAENSAQRAMAIAASRSPSPGVSSTQDKEQQPDMKLSAESLKALGLTADSSEDDVNAAIALTAGSATSKSTPPPDAVDASLNEEVLGDAIDARLSAAFEERDKKIRDLEQERDTTEKTIQLSRVETVLASGQARHKFVPAEKDLLMKMGMQMGPEALSEMLEARPGVEHLSKQIPHGEFSKPGVVDLTDNETFICARLGIEKADFVETKLELARDAARSSGRDDDDDGDDS